tara:strand:- start:11112 stop:12017 length:906 start_codon:yes stop_codon:yes gene_type:complete
MSNIGHNNPPLDPKKAIEKNIERKKTILDRDPQFYNEVPLPSWIELSLIDVCNRTCSFCPKSDPAVAPDTYNKMEIVLIKKLIKDLKKINFQGAFSFCGYGEPLLHPNIIEISNALGEFWAIEVVTNGDPLNIDNIIKLYNSKITKVVVSMYDGPEQLSQFKKLMKDANIPDNFLVLRDRWHKGEEFSDYITNRAGTVTSGKQVEAAKLSSKKCFYPAYHAQIDWNGDCYLCPHDWQRRNTLGNIMQKEFFELWNSKIWNNYRKALFDGKRQKSPCLQCNCDGTVHGSKHYNAWLAAWNKK